MAIKINHRLNVSYTLGRYTGKEYYQDKLTKEQLDELSNSIDKVFLIQGTYCKIISVNGGKEKLSITLAMYKDKTKQVLIDTRSYDFIPDVSIGSENFIRQGYEYLKTIEEYVDAIDVLED